MTAVLSDVGLVVYLLVGFVLFMSGFGGLCINRGSVVISLISLELMFMASVVNFVTFSAYRGEVIGQAYALVVVGAVAAEAVVGLAILSAFYMKKRELRVSKLNSVRG